ncbi:MAG: DNA polymerase III subunit beta [Candidatus Colwellbacteria bacterium]|nr:DNA polymerase III subunit beta [Candidatus Colwellbacteria bacterium]
MNIVILRDNLREGLTTVERGVTETGTLPILKNILIRAEGTKVTFSATNLEIGITKTVPAKVIREGSISIPFATLKSIVVNIDAERIVVETDATTLTVSTDSYTARIQGIRAEDFPIIPTISTDTPALNMKASVLQGALADVVGAAQVSEIRPEISGVLLDAQVTVLTFVATDSFRLAQRKLYNRDFETTLTTGARIIIPLKAAHEVVRILPGDRTVEVFFDDTQVLFTTGDTRIVSRLIGGAYPDYEQIIPKGTDSELTIEREKLMSALKLVSSFAGRVNEVKVRLNEDGKTIEVHAAHQYAGENSYLVPVKATGEAFKEVEFNWRYLMDGVRAITSKHVVLGINSESKPSVITSPEDDAYLYIVMPIKSS